MATIDSPDTSADKTQPNQATTAVETTSPDPVKSLQQFLQIARNNATSDVTSLDAPGTGSLYTAGKDNPVKITPATEPADGLTVSPAFQPTQIGQGRQADPRPWDSIESKKEGDHGALYFDSHSLPGSSKPTADDLVRKFKDELKDGKLDADPVWQKFLAGQKAPNVNDPELQKFLKKQDGNHADGALDKQGQGFHSDAISKKDQDDLVRQIQNSPAWKKFVEGEDIKKLLAGDPIKELQKYFDTHPQIGKAIEADQTQQHKDVAAEHKHLSDWADKTLQEPERSNFKKDMTDLEARAKRDGLSDEEMLKTYKQIERLAEASGDKPLSAVERHRLAEQVMHQAAEPTSITQGAYNTCNVASAECRTYTTHPSDAARLVIDVALTGKYRAPDGTTVTTDTQAHGQSKDWPKKERDRSHASEIFEVTAVNLHYAKENAKSGGNVRYEQQDPSPGDPGDNGERLIDYSKGKPEEVKLDGKNSRQPNLSCEAIADISNTITGANDKDVVLVATDGKTGPGVAAIHSQAELQAKLKELKANHKLPVIVWVDTENEPFYSDSGSRMAGGHGGAHVVTITDYDEKTGAVCIDNQWGKNADHGKNNPVNVHDLFVAMHDKKNAEKLLDGDVKWNRDHGTVDPTKEIDLIRHKLENKEITPQQAEQETQKLIAEEKERYAKQHVPDEQKKREWKEMEALIHKLDPDAQVRLAKIAHDSHVIDDNGYKYELEVAGWQSIHRHNHADGDAQAKALADIAYQKQQAELIKALSELSATDQKKVLTVIADWAKQVP